jgi:predicted transcriptional regulator of viral defense system
MDKETAINRFSDWDVRGRYVFTLRDLAHLFPEDAPKTLKEGVARLVRAGLLQRVCRGVYLYPYGGRRDAHTVERIARALRRGHYSYVSNESALSEYGAISQVPVDRLTLMTTGRRGVYNTPYGVIEFTHTARSVRDVLAATREVGRPLRLATPQTAWRDLKRVGRNTHLVNEDAINNG